MFYRAVTLAALRREVSVHDPEALTALAESLELRLAHGGEGMLVDGEDVTGELRAPDVDASVSSVAETAGVRRAVLRPQREAAGDGNVVMVGRDIGTIVLPGSAKVYLDASVEERARRRALELQAQGARRSEADVRANLEHRDAIDSQRSEAPLRAAADAHVALRPTASTSRAWWSWSSPRWLSSNEAAAVRYLVPAGPRRHAHLPADVRERGGGGAVANVPQDGPLIVAANHQSFSDPPLLVYAISRPLFFLAKRGLFTGPIASLALRRCGMRTP